MTNQQTQRFIPADEGINYSLPQSHNHDIAEPIEIKRFIPADEINYSLPQSHNHDIAKPIEIKEDEEKSYFSKEPKNEISHTNDETSKELINTPLYTNNETSKELITTPLYTNNETSNANHDSNSEQIDKYNQQSWIKILKANYQRLYIIKEALIGDKYVIWHCGKSQVDNNFIWGMTSIHTYCYPSLTSENFVGTFYDCSEVFEKHNHLNKINEAVILHHEGIKAFLNKYNDVQVLRAFYFEATDRFLIFCKDLKVKKTKKEEYCLFWWDWENRITTKSGDYIDCFLQYERLVDVMGNPKPISLPESPDLTAYYRNVTYCPADGKRCEQFTLSLGV